VVASLARQELATYRHHDLGFLVDLGGRKAAANPLGLPLSGLLAKAVTRGYHLLSLPSNRVRAATDWTLNAVMPPRAVQLGLVDAGRVPLQCTDPALHEAPPTGAPPDSRLAVRGRRVIYP
jgi:NADH dehydrogenase